MFTTTTGNLCYVLGCSDQRATQSAQHKLFGRVATCDSHHPDRGGIGLPFGSLDAPVAPAAPVAAPPPAGGTRQRLTVSADPRRPKPSVGPAGTAVDPEVARQRVAAARAAAIAAATQTGGAL
jgi:hypothetical protein